MIRRVDKRIFVLALAVLLLPISATAMDTFMVGPRGMGMGGANVASVSDTTAQYYNPAAFGFFGCRDSSGGRLACDNNNIGRKKWGADLNVAGGYRLHNNLGMYLDRLSDVDVDDLTDRGITSEEDLLNLIKLVGSLKGLDEPGNGIAVDVIGGLAFRVGNFGIGARAYTQATGQVLNVDITNLGFDGNINLNAQLGSLSLSDTGQASPFTGVQEQRLRDAGLTDSGAIRNLELAIIQEGLSQQEIDNAVDLLTGNGNSPGLIPLTQGTVAGGDLDQNATTISFSGFGVVEIPLSYGYSFNEHLAVGANLKLMRGRVYGNQIIVFDEDNDDVLSKTEENFEETNTFGIDVGVMARFPMVNLGLIGRNLNSPKFDGFKKDVLLENGRVVPLSVDEVKIKPQLTAGVAFIPFETLTLEVDYDLTKNDTLLRKGASGPFYQTQNLRFGLEWDAFRFLALRAGAFKNLAEDDIGLVYTAGLGVNLWAIRFDVGGAFSTEKETFDGDEIPSETRVAAQLSVDF